MTIKSKVFSSFTFLAGHSLQNIPKSFVRPQRRHWVWAPNQPSSSDSNRPAPLPELSLEHPDKLPPGKRYMLKIRGPYTHDGSLHPHGRVSITKSQEGLYGFFALPNWTYHPGQSCQLVWDADTRSISIFTETEHPVPGSRRYLKDLLASPKPLTGKVLVDFLIKKGYISHEEVYKISQYHQTDYDLARLQDMEFSQRTRVYHSIGLAQHPRFTFCPRLLSPDHAIRLRDPQQSSGTPVMNIILHSSEKCLLGHDIRIIPHVITNVESGPRLGVHLVEVVGHPNPDFTTVNRPLMLHYRSKAVQPKSEAGVNLAESRPLADPQLPRGQFFLDFVEMVDKHRQQSLS